MAKVDTDSKKKLESEVLREVLEELVRLEAERWPDMFFWRNNNVPTFGQNNAGQKRYRAMPKHTPKGLPDILVILHGITIGMEVKRPGINKVLRTEQNEIRQKFTRAGAKYLIIDCVEEVETALSLIERVEKG